MDSILSYDNLNLPDNPSDILGQDFWYGENVSISLVAAIQDPIKFSATVSVFVKQGECVADINLIEHHIKAPCLVQIRTNQILQPKSVSPDFNCSYLVLSNRLTESLFLHFSSIPALNAVNRFQVVPIPENDVEGFTRFYTYLPEVTNDKDNPYMFQTLQSYILTFFFSMGYKLFMDLSERQSMSYGRISDRFIQLLQQNFKKERFLDFYAEKLGISAKHLSRTVKQQTGYTAVEWIERYVVLEAKVMLRSSSLNIQQIADELNFKSQSFFGKYFKKYTGISPKAFRNI